MDGNLLLLLAACVCLIACSKGQEDRVFNEDLHCPSPAEAQFEPWGNSGGQQICKIKHGAFVAWEGGYVHVRGEYDVGKKSGLWHWYDKEGKVVKEVDYSDESSAEARKNNVILALKDVQFFKAQELGASPRTIRLSGLAFHSALAVRDVTAKQNGISLQVLVHLTPAAHGLSGNFVYEFVVPESVNTVTFGNEEALIWRRDTGLVKR